MTKSEFNIKLEQIKNKPHAIENIEIIKNLIGNDFEYLGNEFTIQKRFNNTIVVIEVNLKTGEILNYKIKVNGTNYENEIVFESYVYLSLEAHLEFFLVLFSDYLERFYAQKDESSFNPNTVNSGKTLEHFFDNYEEKRKEKRSEREFQKIQQLIKDNKNVLVCIDNDNLSFPSTLEHLEDESYKLFQLDMVYTRKLFEYYKVAYYNIANVFIFKEAKAIEITFVKDFFDSKFQGYIHKIFFKSRNEYVSD